MHLNQPPHPQYLSTLGFGIVGSHFSARIRKRSNFSSASWHELIQRALPGGTTSQLLRPYLHGIQVLSMLRLSQGFRHWGSKKPEHLEPKVLAVRTLSACPVMKQINLKGVEDEC